MIKKEIIEYIITLVLLTPILIGITIAYKLALEDMLKKDKIIIHTIFLLIIFALIILNIMLINML